MSKCYHCAGTIAVRAIPPNNTPTAIVVVMSPHGYIATWLLALESKAPFS